MGMKDWARKEIELACKHENPDWDGESFDYGIACYKSALKAYESLLEDGHSGFSFGLTVGVLNRLMNGLPLTPIEDTDAVWEEVRGTDAEYKHYQCKRMSSLFKQVYPDGTITYNDVDRDYTFDPDDEHGVTWHCGVASRIVDELYPITMPYCPTVEKFRIATKEYLTDRLNGDLDTYAIMWIDTPCDGRIKVDRYFKNTDDGWTEIDYREFHDRVCDHRDRERKEEAMSEEEFKEYNRKISEELHKQWVKKYGDKENDVCCGG